MLEKGGRLVCPSCGEIVRPYRNPVPTVDVIIEVGSHIVLIARRNPPKGLALPGGFVDYGEPVAVAAVREAKEETGLDVKITRLLGVYSDPERDSRLHTMSVVFVARSDGEPVAGDDARDVFLVKPEDILTDVGHQLCFDHARIIADYLASISGADQPGCFFS